MHQPQPAGQEVVDEVKNIIAELPDGCIPVSIWLPHPEGGIYCVDSRVYGLAGRLSRFMSYTKGEYMSDQDRQLAREHASEAAQQSRRAAKKAAEAARLAAAPAADEAERVAGEVVDDAKDAAKRVNVRGLSAISGDAGTGFLALSVALYAGAIAYNKFSSAYKGRGRAVTR